jgi:hypothetical protein
MELRFHAEVLRNLSYFGALQPLSCPARGWRKRSYTQKTKRLSWGVVAGMIQKMYDRPVRKEVARSESVAYNSLP